MIIEGLRELKANNKTLKKKINKLKLWNNLMRKLLQDYTTKDTNFLMIDISNTSKNISNCINSMFPRG